MLALLKQPRQLEQKTPAPGNSEAERREAAYAEACTLINPKGFGFFCILYGVYNWRGQLVDKRQRSYPNRDLRKVIDKVLLNRDTWISQSRFNTWGTRTFEHLRDVNALWIDLDYYKIEGMTADQALAELYSFCDDMNFPYPSTVIDSGHGLQVKWLLDASIAPRHIKPWHAAQKTLHQWFKSIGSDDQALDACRVLRLVGSKHTKQGTFVKKIGGTDERYSFEYLAEFMPETGDLDSTTDHPYSDVEKQKKVAARLAREAAYKTKLARKTIKVVAVSEKKSNKSNLGVQKLNWTRYNDLLKLQQIRGKLPGQAMTHLFYTMNFLALSGAVTSAEFAARAGTLCQQLGLGEITRYKELKMLIIKLEQKERGETKSFAGMQWTTLYTPNNETLIETFGISEVEQREMKTIIGNGEKRRRRALRDGVKSDRVTFLSNVEDKRVTARSMRANGISITTICADLKISRMTLNRYTKELM